MQPVKGKAKSGTISFSASGELAVSRPSDWQQRWRTEAFRVVPTFCPNQAKRGGETSG